MDISLFDYPLPARLIADRPAEPRESAKLLDLTSGEPVDRTINDLPDILTPGTILVVNNTRVLPARLTGRRIACPFGRVVPCDRVSSDRTMHRSRAWLYRRVSSTRLTSIQAPCSAPRLPHAAVHEGYLMRGP